MSPGGPAPTTVLVVDDDAAVRETLRFMLIHAGYRVLVAESGPAGLDLLREHGGSVSCVLLDLRMPGWGGEETFARMREVRGDLPVLVVSGFLDSASWARLRARGCDGFLRKPFRVEALVERLEQVLWGDAPASDETAL